MKALLHALATARIDALLAAVLAYLAGVLAIGLRMECAARGAGTTLGSWRAMAIHLSGVLVSHVSFGGAAGEAARFGWLAGDRTGARKAAMTLLLDRVADGVAIAVLVCFALGRTHLPWLVLVVPAVGVVALGLVGRRMHLTPATLLRTIGSALPAALVAWAADLARVYLVARSVGLVLDVHHVATLALASLVGSQAPTPAGLGATEGAMVGAGMALGLPGAPLLASLLLDRVVTLGLGTGLGILGTHHLVRQRRSTPWTR